MNFATAKAAASSTEYMRSRFAVRAPRSLVRCAPPSIEFIIVFEQPMATGMVINTMIVAIGKIPMIEHTAIYTYVTMISNAYEYAAVLFLPCVMPDATSPNGTIAVSVSQ